MNGQDLLTTFSKFVSDFFTSSTTAEGNAGGTSLVDSRLTEYGDRRLIGRTVRFLSGDLANQTRVVSNNVGATGTITFTPAVADPVPAGTAYELHRYAPDKKFRALDEARYDVADDVFKLVHDYTLTADGRSSTFAIPDTIRIGPIQAYLEDPVPAANQQWNFLASPQGDILDGWTPTNCTASVVENEWTDLVVPKYDMYATRIVTNGSAATYAQARSAMHGISAGRAAGRKMSFLMWVHCHVPQRVRLELNGSFSTYHQGLGWELLQVEKVFDDTATTGPDVSLNVSAGDPVSLFWNRAWLYFGEAYRVADSYVTEAFPVPDRDFTTRKFSFNTKPSRGRQIKLVGQGVISPLGEDPDTQGENETEVDAESARVLCAAAARILLEWEGLTAANAGQVFQRIIVVEQRAQRTRKFGQNVARKSIVSPYWR